MKTENEKTGRGLANLANLANYTLDKAKQTDKDDKMVILYAANTDEQHSYIEAAKAKGYEVLLLDSPIVSHLMQKLETSKEKISFVRVDADHIDNLIKKRRNI